MVFEENRFILDLLEVVPKENVIAIRTKSLVDVISGALNALLRVRREGIDAAVDLEFFARSTAVLSFLTGYESGWVTMAGTERGLTGETS